MLKVKKQSSKLQLGSEFSIYNLQFSLNDSVFQFLIIFTQRGSDFLKNHSQFLGFLP